MDPGSPPIVRHGGPRPRPSPGEMAQHPCSRSRRLARRSRLLSSAAASLCPRRAAAGQHDGAERLRAVKELLRPALLHEAAGHDAYARPRQRGTPDDAVRGRTHCLQDSRHTCTDSRQMHTQHAGGASRLACAPCDSCLDHWHATSDAELAHRTTNSLPLAARRLTLQNGESARAAVPAQVLRPAARAAQATRGGTWAGRRA